MYNYGILRSQIFKKHGSGLLWLHFLPSLAIVFIPLMAIFSLIVQPIKLVVLVIVLLYVIIAAFSALNAFLIQKKGNPFLVSIAFLSMHIAWALGFWQER